MGKNWKIFTAEMQKKILKESEAPDCVIKELAAKYGIRKQRIYNWRTKHKRENTGFVEARLTQDGGGNISNSVKKASFEFAEFTISIEGNFDGRKLEKIMQVGN